MSERNVIENEEKRLSWIKSEMEMCRHRFNSTEDLNALEVETKNMMQLLAEFKKSVQVVRELRVRYNLQKVKGLP